MTAKENQRRKIARAVMFEAWRTYRRCLLSFGTCLRICWRTVRCQLTIYHSKVRGTTFGKRQEVIRRLSAYATSDIRLSLQRDQENTYHPNAIRVVATVRNKGSMLIGYIGRELADSLAPILDDGGVVVAMLNSITGLDRMEGYLGLNYDFVIL